MPLPLPIHCAQLFYDGRCSLCAREMAFLRKHKSNRLVLTDIHHLLQMNEAEREIFLLELHLLQPDGTWLRGVDATVAAWSFTAFGFLVRPLRWPLVAPLVDKLYRRWAQNRYCKLYRTCHIKET